MNIEEEDFKNKFREEISKKICNDNPEMNNYFTKKMEEDTDGYENKIIKNNEKIGKIIIDKI